MRFTTGLILALSLTASAATIVVGTPSGAGSNSVPFGTVVPVYQQVYSSAIFSVVSEITAVSFSRTAVASSFPNTITAATYTFSFSTTTKAVGGLDNVNLADNLGLDNQQFFSGNLSGNPGAVLSITGVIPYLFNPTMGNLLLTITQTGGVCCGGIFFDAESGTATQFSRASGFVGTSGYGLVTTFTFEEVPEPNSFYLYSVFLVLACLIRKQKSVASSNS